MVLVDDPHCNRSDKSVVVMKYPKIQTLWKRDPDNKYRIIEGEYSRPEFENIKQWDVTEKIDGENARVIYEDGRLRFGGKTDRAQLSARFFQYLQQTFISTQFEDIFDGIDKVILFGESYGAGVKKGGMYRSDNAFILFDVWVDGWWLRPPDVADIAQKLRILSVPVVGTMTAYHAVKYVQSSPDSLIAQQTRPMEGIVARASPMVLYRDGTPVGWKLKAKDYQVPE